MNLHKNPRFHHYTRFTHVTPFLSTKRADFVLQDRTNINVNPLEKHTENNKRENKGSRTRAPSWKCWKMTSLSVVFLWTAEKATPGGKLGCIFIPSRSISRLAFLRSRFGMRLLVEQRLVLPRFTAGSRMADVTQRKSENIQGSIANTESLSFSLSL